MKRLTFTMFILCGLVLAGCNGTPERRGVSIDRVVMPEWTRTGAHPDYPQGDYLVAYGFARSTREAHSIAVERIENAICNHVRNQYAELFKDTHFSEVVTLRAQWFRAHEFGRAVREDAASNGFESVALRAIHYDELGLRAKSMLPDAKKELEENPMPPAGIGSVQKRLELWGNFFLRAVRVVSLELLAGGTLNRPVFEQLEEATLTLWELPALISSTRGGSGQHVRIRGGAANDLTLLAGFRGTSVAGVPLVWGPAPGYSGDVQGDREFNEEGLATARVLYLQPTGAEIGYVGATLDLDAFMGRALGIAMNLWLWNFTLPCRTNAELIIDVEESRNGSVEGVEEVFTPELEKWCKTRELKTSREEGSGLELPYRLKLTGSIDVVSSSSDDVPTGFARGSLLLTDLETGEVLFSYTLGVRKTGEPGAPPALVELGAAQEGTAEIMIELAPRLASILPAEESEFERPR